MGKIRLILNGDNLELRFGVIATPNTLSTLLLPPPVKEPISNQSRLEDGARYEFPQGEVKFDKRELSLELHLIADDKYQFYERLENFYNKLKDGNLALTVIDENHSIDYHFIYQSCSQFTQFNRGIATLALKLIEPNPANRIYRNITSNE